MKEFFEENLIFFIIFFIFIQLIIYFVRMLFETLLTNDLEKKNNQTFSFSWWQHVEKELLKDKHSISIFYKPYKFIIYFQYSILIISVLLIIITNILNKFSPH
ncbi:hypothetical protein DLM77_11660 [Leptospira yasudae]|uniref:Uncharacterized protein n=1 Tax=Leptospira yasudae TaxID=2202201 RepID=A0ABX9M226_9LEPT|nr:hypothetical protein DLM77_11660 [Leptospira yasudae]